jgi:hypothetical protein
VKSRGFSSSKQILQEHYSGERGYETTFKVSEIADITLCSEPFYMKQETIVSREEEWVLNRRRDRQTSCISWSGWQKVVL